MFQFVSRGKVDVDDHDVNTLYVNTVIIGQSKLLASCTSLVSIG